MDSQEINLPYSVKAEQGLIGAMILDAETVDELAADYVHVLDFYSEAHRRIVNVICEMVNARRYIDLITLSEQLESQKELEFVGGIAYLGLLAQGAPTAKGIVDYAKIIRKKSVQRKMIALGERLVEFGQEPTGPLCELADHVANKLYELKSVGFV